MVQVKNFLAERVQQLESPDGFESEMATIKTQLTILEGENATFAEESARSAKLVRELQDQVNERNTSPHAWVIITPRVTLHHFVRRSGP